MAEAPSSDTTGISEAQWYRERARREMFDQHSFDPEVRRRAKEALAADAKALHARWAKEDAKPETTYARATPDPHAAVLKAGLEKASLTPPGAPSVIKEAALEAIGVGAVGPLLMKAARHPRVAEFLADEGASGARSLGREAATPEWASRLGRGAAHYGGKAAEAAKKAIVGTPGKGKAAKEVAAEVPIEDVIVESKRIQASGGQPLDLTLDEHVASAQEAFPDWPREEILQDLVERGVPTTPEGYAKFVDDQLVEMVEAPALGVARELVRQGKKPVWSNAYGAGQKGVWYRDKGVGPSPGEGHVLRDPNVKFAPLPDEALAQIRKEVAEEVAEGAPKAAGLPPKAATRAPFQDESVTARATEKIRESLKPGGEAVEEAADTAATAGARTVDEAADAAKQWQEKGVESPYFKRWFGDSKVVDEGGEPVVLYHGTMAEFDDPDVFRPEKGELGIHFGSSKQADQAIPIKDQGRTYAAYISVKNPLRLRDEGSWGFESLRQRPDLFSEKELNDVWEKARALTLGRDAVERGLQSLVKSKGYDGIVYLNRREGIDTKELAAVLGLDPSKKGWSPSLRQFLMESSDDEFLSKLPGTQDSYIVFEPDQVRHRQHRHLRPEGRPHRLPGS